MTSDKSQSAEKDMCGKQVKNLCNDNDRFVIRRIIEMKSNVPIGQSQTLIALFLIQLIQQSS